MKYKVGKKIFRFTFLICLTTFLVLYFSGGMGYFEYENYKKTSLTEEKIKEFEKDVNAGRDVDIKDYLPKDTSNYQNTISSFGLKVSNRTKECVNTVIEKGFKALAKLAGL